ncbi:hypothetical protein [Bacillus aerius]|uniref:hypothetical protein n=1 Tax=Bacillus aerius TaxID=293388 RepID=UPI00247E0669|nr:hypothetical protein [Bacillus aerius]MDH6596099.1 CRISPR/Cas system-associated endoribonuclease Cas2 [Bacillus aerius]
MNKSKAISIFMIIIMIFTQKLIPSAAAVDEDSNKGDLSWGSDSVQLNEGDLFETTLDILHPIQKIQVKIPNGLSISLQQMKEDKRNEHVQFNWDAFSSTVTISSLKGEGEEKAIGNVFMVFKLSKASTYSLTAEAVIENTMVQSPPLVINVEKKKEETELNKETAELKLNEGKKLARIKQQMVQNSTFKALSTQSEDVGTIVSSWSEFIQALADPAVHVISLSQSISKGFGISLGTYRRDITINGEWSYD